MLNTSEILLGIAVIILGVIGVMGIMVGIYFWIIDSIARKKLENSLIQVNTALQYLTDNNIPVAKVEEV